MRIVGCDVDSHKIAAVCFQNGKLKERVCLTSNAKDTQDRVFDLYSLFESGVIKGLEPDRVYIEDSIYVQNFRTSKSITEVISYMKLLCQQNDVFWQTVPVRKWKKDVLGNGKADKAEIKDFVLNRYKGFDDEVQDLCDALCISLWGVQQYRLEQEKENDGKLE